MVDIAIAYDQTRRCCDVVYANGDFALDDTPASAMLFSVLANRRAAPDDAVPTQVRDWAYPSSFSARGGWVGDALDPNGQLTGSKLWLLWRALADEQTLQDATNYIAESVRWLETIRGLALDLKVAYIAAQILGYLLIAGSTELQLSQAVGG